PIVDADPPLLLLVVLAVLVAIVYGWRIAMAPLYLAHDEVLFAIESHSLATTLHDVSGRFLPLYVPVRATYWCSPVHIYVGALLLRFAPMTETVVRLPSVAAGLTTIALMFVAARRLFRSGWY